MKKYIITSILLSYSFAIFAQEGEQVEPNLELPKLSYIDSLKATFVNHNTSNCIDERWMAELSNEEIFEEMQSDVTEIDIDSLGNINYDLSTEVLKKRLAKLDAQSP